MKKQGSIVLSSSILFGLFFSAISSGLLSVAKADSVIATIMVGTGPYGDLYDPANGNIYIANFFSNSVSVISGSTNSVIATINLGASPRELAYDSANGDIYTANAFSNTISVIDGKTNTLVTSITTGGIPDGVAYDSRNGFIYAVNAGPGTVSVIDGSKNQVIGSIPVGTNPLTDVFDPDNGYIYVANQLSPSVSIIDGSKNQVIGTITGTPNPIQLSYNPANKYIYVVNYDNTNVVSVIDTRTNAVIGTISGFSNPAGVGYDSADGNMYVTNQGSNYVSIISGQTVVGKVTVGSGPVSPAFDPKNGNVYVTDFHSNDAPGNTVSVISTITSPQPPDTSITTAVDGHGSPVQNGSTTLSTSIQFTFTGTSNIGIAGFECRLDSGVFSPCSNPTQFNHLAAGKHTFQVRAVDTSGNRDPSPASFRWTILTPAQGISQLIQLVNSMNLNHVTQNSLVSHLNAALQFLTQSPVPKAGSCVQLTEFVIQVQGALRLGQVTSAQASQLIQAAQNIQTALGCPGNGIVASQSTRSSLNSTQSQAQPQITAMSPSLMQPESPYGYQIPQSQLSQNHRAAPIANAGISHTVNENAKVTLDGRASYAAYGETIVTYQWMQLPTGVAVILNGANTGTPTFTAPLVSTDTVLAFSLRVLDNHGAMSANPAVVYVMVKHNPNIGATPGSNAPSTTIIQPHQEQQPPVPNNNAIGRPSSSPNRPSSSGVP